VHGSAPLLFFQFKEEIMPTTDEVAHFMLNKLKDQFSGSIEGAEDDVEAFFAELSSDYAQAVVTGASDVSEEIIAQLDMLAEKHRLRFMGGVLDTIKTILQIVSAVIITFIP
jgi:hypothetical protein